VWLFMAFSFGGNPWRDANSKYMTESVKKTGTAKINMTISVKIGLHC
jgi:hypothetical protein